jgi:hypothetical protein
MSTDHDPKLRRIWGQGRIPVVLRRGKGEPLRVRLPYAEANRAWLRGENRNKPQWNPRFKCWETPKSWFENLIRRALWIYESIYAIQPFNHSTIQSQ